MISKIKKIAIRLAAATLCLLIEIYRLFRPIPPKIYFCYNQSIHHVYHSIFIAMELSNCQDRYEVVVFSTSREASDIIEEELGSCANNVKFKKIYHPGYNKIDYDVNWFVLWCRLRMHRPKAVVVTDYFDNIFRQLGVRTFWVYVAHGGKSHAYGYDPHIKDYDLVIVPGERVLEQIRNRMGKIDNCLMIGYSKLDYFHYHKIETPRLFKSSKPIILYNPHFKKELSSFFDKGPDFLRALSATNRYNTIFMPHPDLARKNWRLVNSIERLENVVVVARPKNNLNYMSMSHLYITDLSSAAFEWSYFDKPVLFFNTKGIKWFDNEDYSLWRMGQVVADIPAMLKAIEHSLGHQYEFRPQRQQIFNQSFVGTKEKVSLAIAQAILDKIKDI